MTLKEYRQKRGMTLKDLSEELKELDPRITVPLLSYMENGVVETPDSVKEFLARKRVIVEEPLTENEDIVLRCLTGHFKDSPMERGDLKYWSGLPDRIVRKAIEGLRNRGYWILNDGYGYYLTNDREELKRWLAVYTARARSVFKTAGAMLDRMDGQLSMVDIESTEREGENEEHKHQG